MNLIRMIFFSIAGYTSGWVPYGMTWEEETEFETATAADTPDTYYRFRNDNVPVLQMETDKKFFAFIVSG